MELNGFNFNKSEKVLQSMSVDTFDIQKMDSDVETNQVSIFNQSTNDSDVETKQISIFNQSINNLTKNPFDTEIQTISSDDIDIKIINSELNKYIDALNDINNTKETKNENDAGSFESIMDLTQEDISEMTGEEIAELLHSAIGRLIMDNMTTDSSLTKDKLLKGNHTQQNAMLFSLVNKMSDEQLSDFIKAYKENYPSKTGENSIDIAGFDALASGALWGNYAVSAGLIDKDEANSALNKLKDYFPKLRSDIDNNGYKQWL